MWTSVSRSPARRVRCVSPVSVGVQMAAPTTHLPESSTAQVSTSLPKGPLTQSNCDSESDSVDRCFVCAVECVKYL